MFQCIRRVEQISLPDRAVVLEYFSPSNVRAVAERSMYYRGSHYSGSGWAYLTGTLMSSSGAIASPESRGYLCSSTSFSPSIPEPNYDNNEADRARCVRNGNEHAIPTPIFF